MQRWEYFTTTLDADSGTTPIPVRDDIPAGDHGKHSPYTLMPRLNTFGYRGWELLSIEPVSVGKHEDVVLPRRHSRPLGTKLLQLLQTTASGLRTHTCTT